MNKAIQYLALASALVFGLASCVEKAPQYEPADAVGNAEVFFAPTLPASYNLKGNEGTFSVTVSRLQNTGSLTVSLNSSASGEFSVPSSVTFDAGAKTASLDISFNPEDLEEDVDYPFTLTLASETTPYGAAEYSFTASVPAAWVLFESPSGASGGTLTEVWWGETETNMKLWYQDLSETLRICKIEGCFGHNTIADGDPYDVQDYIFYWNTETNNIYIPLHYMGYTPANYGVPVFYGDEPAFYNKYWDASKGAQQVEGSAEWFAFCDAFRAKYPEDYYPYYDGNGGFYLADQYIVGMPGTDDYLGRYNAGSDWDYYIAKGFVRITDYNDDKHIGASSALYEGVMESLLFSQDGEPYEFEQSLRYDADYEYDPEKYDPKKDEIITTTYYLPNYFAENQCLAFTAPIPELLEDGSEISDVDNEQAAGIKLIGYDLYAKVKKGTVSFPEAEEDEDVFPTFEISVAVYTKDDEGNVAQDFGNVKEIFTANEYGKDNYTVDDIGGAYKESYLGDWIFFARDYFDDGAEFQYEGLIEDAGQDEEGGELVKITNLSGAYGTLGLVDEIYASWDDSYGLLWLYGQDLEKPITLSGAEYAVGVYPFDPDAEESYSQDNCLVGGLTDDYVLAFVNVYSDANMSGLNYYVPDLGGSVAIIYYIYGYPASSSSASYKHVGFNNYNKLVKKAQVAGRGVTVNNRQIGKQTGKKTAAKRVAPMRTVNVNNCVKAEKNIGTLADAPLK